MKKASNTKKLPDLQIDEEYKSCIIEKGYLGKKGYTIPKSCLSKEDYEFLKKDLLLQPQIMGAKMGIQQQTSSFPVYRENTNKIYIPRFYGIERYGLPKKSELQQGDDVELEFVKTLRDYQEDIIKVYLDHANTPVAQNDTSYGNGGILEVPCGAGKTVMALKIITLLKKKTLIIVHKEFLMNQWIDRIKEFVPNARVGKIQGSTFDIHGKDIVIGMLQSLYDKEYGIGAYDSFGLTIIDEVHRIGSEQFSRALCKTITPYMLGISATVDRKDGLTKVLYMFIGNKIYSQEREKEDKVNVRGIVYETNDPEFNEIEYDFRGNVKYSTMISKICGYGPRTHFIANTLRDLLEEDNEKQIMVLCHNRSFLTDLHQIIVDKELCSVGFYVGGMKQAALQETESKQIVLATYAMAAEALDIKTLSTLVMASPKTDITQSVGRILRMKHDNPIIVDIIDKHDTFQNQWKQRRRYYKKCNYLIKHICLSDYKNMLDYSDEKSDWDVLFDPSKTGKSKGNGSKSSSSDNTKEEHKCLITGFFD
jgi:superfamily II DNA or RNA helicase